MAVLKLNYDQAERILELQGLRKWFDMKYGLADRLAGKPRQVLKAVDGVDLTIFRGENLGLVGESGCGKSTLAKTVLRLYEPTAGKVIFQGTDISHIRGEQLRALRPGIQMIFQDPYSSLDPRKTCGKIVEEPMVIHKTVKDRAQREERVRELMRVVGLDAQHVHRFPHEFSGGQRQRINIARALSLSPDLLVCDEPVSALDVSIQAQVLNLFGKLQKEFGLTYVFISHDLSVIRHISDRIAIMYLGQVVELCGAEGIYDSPLHPYTQALLSAIPPASPFEKKKAIELSGDIPSPIGDQVGCPLASRCPHCTDRCRRECPQLTEQTDGHQVACFLYDKERAR